MLCTKNNGNYIIPITPSTHGTIIHKSITDVMVVASTFSPVLPLKSFNKYIVNIVLVLN
jgi:hypothetical protein